MKILVRIIGALVALALLLIVVGRFLPPVSTLMIAEWLQGDKVRRSWVKLEHISPSVMRSLVAAEDGRFCDHHGIDWKAMRMAVEDALDNDEDASHGASTIPMQTAKNLFLWHGRSYLRKGLEMPLAVVMDALWSKRRMMEVYLNMAEWGPGIFGVEAASQYYFRKSARALSPYESALLVAVLPNPVKRNAANPSPYVKAYAGRILGRAQKGADLTCVYRK